MIIPAKVTPKPPVYQHQVHLATDQRPPRDVPAFIWDDHAPPADNYRALARRLAATGRIFRRPEHGTGLLLVAADGDVPFRAIDNAAKLGALIVDCVEVQIVKGEKMAGSRIAASHLGTMLLTDAFLGEFRVVDLVTRQPVYLADFTLTAPGYNDGGPGYRAYYVGESTWGEQGIEMIEKFLGLMPFASTADRTNTVAAALTVLLRNHFPGGKPVVPVTANKSHGGKGTVVDFIAGKTKSVQISYQSTDWALERAAVGVLKHQPDAGVLTVDNARVDNDRGCIRSGFLERHATDPNPVFFSTGSGGPMNCGKDIVIAITTNDGSLSPDLMNRALPIRLEWIGDVATRESPIGNPRHEFLPAQRSRIDAELRGMIERWYQAGCPRDTDVRHPFSEWAQIVGGILKANGFQAFLANYTLRGAVDDPIRRSLGILGAGQPDIWLPAAEWSEQAASLGLVSVLVGSADRRSSAGCVRGMGVVMTAHQGEVLHAETDDERFTLQIEKARRRFVAGEPPQTRYRFEVRHRETIPAEDDGPAPDEGPGAANN